MSLYQLHSIGLIAMGIAIAGCQTSSESKPRSDDQSVDSVVVSKPAPPIEKSRIVTRVPVSWGDVPLCLVSLNADDPPVTLCVSQRFDTLIVKCFRGLERGYPEVRYEDTNEIIACHGVEEHPDFASTYLLRPGSREPAYAHYEYALRQTTDRFITFTWIIASDSADRATCLPQSSVASDDPYPTPEAEIMR